jgi:hypothetical protein
MVINTYTSPNFNMAWLMDRTAVLQQLKTGHNNEIDTSGS